MKVLETRGLQDYVKEYVSKLSIGAVFKAKIEDAQSYVYDSTNTVFLADLLLFLNMFGVVYLLFYSIKIRKDLV